jgi:hypothetical protein
MSKIIESDQENKINLNGNINRININEEEFNFINDLSNEPKIEDYQFENPQRELKWQWTHQNSYHFKQDIERVWLIARNFDLMALINNKGNYPCISDKGQDTWKVGNEFKGNLFGFLPFKARVEKSINLPEMKKIKWLFNIKRKDYLVIKIELFKVTEDNTCVLLVTMKLENIQFLKIVEKVHKNESPNILFKNVEELLENEPINLFQYESATINAKMEDIWNIVTDYNNLCAIAPNNNCFPNINIGNMSKGETKTITFFCNNKSEEIDITLQHKDERKGWNKWIYVITISSGIPKKKPKQTIVIQLTKINKAECQLSFTSKFHDSVETKKFNENSERIKYLLLSLKDYFDNFYSPDAFN